MAEQADDLETPAMRRVVKTTASPGAIAEAMEDPDIFAQVARGDLYMELTRLRRLSNSNAMPISARLEYAKFLAKMGQVEKPEQLYNPLDGVPGIHIYLPGAGQRVSAGATVNGEFSHKDD